MSIFGTAAGVEEEIYLPMGTILDRKQQLEWEKELIGLYVSDHPITPFLPLIRERVTHFSKELPEATNKQKVVVAGLVSRIRTLMTKTGNQMAFATIEDIQGLIELVIFPKAWEKMGALVQMDSVILVEGKVDLDKADPKVLVDTIKPLRESDIKPLKTHDSKPGGGEPTIDPPVDGEPQSDERAAVEPWQGDIDTSFYAQQEDQYEEPPPTAEEAEWRYAPPQRTDTGTVKETPAVQAAVIEKSDQMAERSTDDVNNGNQRQKSLR